MLSPQRCRAASWAFFGVLCAILARPAAAASASAVARELRESGLDETQCYRIRDVNYTRDDLRLFFNDGYLIFSKPVQGRRWIAVFSSNVEGGDAEVIVMPPTREERQALASFTQSPNLDEHLRDALMVSSRGLEDSLLARIQDDPGARKSPEMGAELTREWNSTIAVLAGRLQIRLVADLLTPKDSVSGLELFALNGRKLGNFDAISDARANRRIEIRQPMVSDGKTSVNIWTSFLPRSVRKGAAYPVTRAPAPFQLSQYSIDSEIDSDLTLGAHTRVRVQVGANPVRVFPFELASAMNVTAVRVDGQVAEVLRDRTVPSRGGANGIEDEFLVVPEKELAAGSTHEFEFEHIGNVIATRGEGVYFVDARGSWYPHVSGQFATYELSFRYPKRLTLVAAGQSVEERLDGETKITRRRIDIPAGAAGFNLGVYEKIAGTASGVAYEVYGNRNLETSLRPQVTDLPSGPPARGPGQARFGHTPIPQQSLSLAAPDPLSRLRAVAADLASSLDFFSTAFGPPALKNLTIAPIPGTFGQGFPGLVYLSTFAYLDPAERPIALRNAREKVFFSDLLVPHETAHQWWGSLVTADRREDVWLVEALANYSALLWLEKKKGFKAVQEVLDSYRSELLSKNPSGIPLESAGPVVWGDRLESSSPTWRVITYDKGTWIIHMLRRRMGDEAFMKLLRTAQMRYAFRSITTADFQALAIELRPKALSPEAIDNFFNSWIYRTGIPNLKVRFSQKGTAPAIKLTGSLEQSDAEDDFSAEIPVEVQTGHIAVQTLWVRTGSEAKNFSLTLTQPATRVAIPSDVLVQR